MRLTPHEQDRLAIRTAAQLARERLDRGRRLNHPEATAVLADWVLESARDGRTVADLMQAGRQVLTRGEVMVGVPEMLHQVQIEATFPDGTKLVTLHDPIGGPRPEGDESLVPGEIVGPDGTPEGGDPIEINGGRPVTTLRVENAGDRPVQVGSHYHFAEANPSLDFDRVAARGHRLDIPAGTAIRFEPGIAMDVDLVPLAGARVVAGLRGDVAGPLEGTTDGSGS